MNKKLLQFVILEGVLIAALIGGLLTNILSRDQFILAVIVISALSSWIILTILRKLRP
jgi:hypothetical protein